MVYHKKVDTTDGLFEHYVYQIHIHGSSYFFLILNLCTDLFNTYIIGPISKPTPYHVPYHIVLGTYGLKRIQ